MYVDALIFLLSPPPSASTYVRTTHIRGTVLVGAYVGTYMLHAALKHSGMHILQAHAM